MQLVSNIYLIKDLSRRSGHSIHTLKFYLKIGLIRESGRSPETRFRYFDDTTLATLSQIRALRKQRKSLVEIQHLLNGHGGSSGLTAQSSAPLPPRPDIGQRRGGPVSTPQVPAPEP